MKKIKGRRGRPLGRSPLGPICGVCVGVGGGGTVAEDVYPGPSRISTRVGFLKDLI